MQDSVARLLRAPPYAARRKGLSFGYPSCLRSQSDRSTVVVGNCTFCTDNGGSSPRQSNSFRRSSILFRPQMPPTRVFGGAAGYRPRVRSAYYLRVYAHSPGEPEQAEYRRGPADTQGSGCQGDGADRRCIPDWPVLPHREEHVPVSSVLRKSTVVHTGTHLWRDPAHIVRDPIPRLRRTCG